MEFQFGMLRVTRMKKEAKLPREDSPHAVRKIPSRGETRFQGIVADAKALGVSRVHLYLVLDGRRQSARLLARYNELKTQQAVAPAQT